MSAISTKTRSVRSVAPEDLRVGDYVAVISRMYEFPSFNWNTDCVGEQLIRMRLLPIDDAGMPYKVLAICLPFVLVRSPSKKAESFDLRRHQLGKLDKRYAKAATKYLVRKRKQ